MTKFESLQIITGAGTRETTRVSILDNVSQQQDQGKLEQIYKHKKHLSVPSNLLGKECENI